MSMTFSASGSFDNIERMLKKASTPSVFDVLSHYGEAGRSALAAATPVESGETAAEWYYEIVQDATSWSIIWGNNHVEDGRPIAVLLQYGHGTRNGGYVEGRDYINPALRSLFDQMANDGWKVVTTA